MRQNALSPGAWLLCVRRFLASSIALHLVWEILQLPLYTLWRTGSVPERLFAVVHCTIGDGMIAGLSLLVALAAFASERWPESGVRKIWLAMLALGVAYTIYSEWLNVTVRGSWAYAAQMPTVPPFGTGLTPLAQWIVVPTVALWISLRRPPWVERA